MKVFMVERNLQGIDAEGLTAAQSAAIEASRTCHAQGTPVRYLRSMFLPGVDRCFCLFEADNAEHVRALNDMARLPYASVSEAWELPSPVE